MGFNTSQTINLFNGQQLQWLEKNETLGMDIARFFKQNNNSVVAKAFGKLAVEAMNNDGIDDGVVDFEELYISDNIPDDDYIYQGPKQLIPNPLVLSNGDEVSVTFITHTKDKKSSNQMVSLDLIDGMRFAFEEANSNLSDTEKITSINVYATTNGHGTTGTSNHLKTTAVDINRINGNRMVETGITNQIIELQKSFDNFPYIRENFGPYFKHKFSLENPIGNQWNYNYPVSGHSDHIHIAVKK